ncbi:MAG TPA: hypothetical protein PKM21_14970 [Anaerolineales bacterium]|nr:hypothetical protein [Anaerolineales bacterium]
MDNRVKEFSYGKAGISLSIIPATIIFLIPLVFLIKIVVDLITYLYAWIIGSPASLMTMAESIGGSIVGMGICLFMLPLPLVLLNQYNTIQVVEKGLKITTFGPFLFWKFIPWKDIVGIEKATRVDRWGQTTWVIKVKKLTPWHQYLGKFYGFGDCPIILLTSDMEDREQLVELIKQNCPTVKSVTP